MATAVLGQKNGLPFGKYNNAKRQSECVVTILTGKKPCGYKIAGRIQKNLKRHLKVHHTECEVIAYRGLTELNSQ